MNKLFEIEEKKEEENWKPEKSKKTVFKEYEMNKIQLLPNSIETLIPENHIVRVVNRIIESIDLTSLLKKYEGGGTSIYHPKMLLKVIVYSYSQRIFSGREMAKQIRENINYMWISAGNKPDFRTINRFRSNTMKEEIEKIFSSVIELLIKEKYIKFENYFLDGTKIEANANKYTFVWRKSTVRYMRNLKENLRELYESIDQISELEEKKYEGKDYPEVEQAPIKTEELNKTIEEVKTELKLAEKVEKDKPELEINSKELKEDLEEMKKELCNNPEKKDLSKAVKKIEENYLPRLEKYELYMEVLDKRNSFSKTDRDATFMRMKEDHMKNGQLKAGYNIQIGTENQFILGYSIHQKPSDSTCLIPHLERTKHLLKDLPKNIIADAGYGSEENYEYLKEEQKTNYVKYNIFHKEDTKKYKNDQYNSANFEYNEEEDYFKCPVGKKMKYKNETKAKSENGYESTIRHYECESCENCQCKEKCTKAQGNRVIQVNFNLKKHRKEAKENLCSETGVALRKQRCIDVEPVFGIIKNNCKFHRFLLKGIPKVNIEWGLISIAHNIKKLWATSA